MQQKIDIGLSYRNCIYNITKKSGAAIDSAFFLHHACGNTFAGAWRDILFTCCCSDSATSSALAIIVFCAIRSYRFLFRTFSGFGSYRLIIITQNYGTNQIAFAIAVLGAILACRFKLRTYEFIMLVKRAVFVAVNRTVFIIDVIDARQPRFAIRRFGAEFPRFFRRSALLFYRIGMLPLAVVADNFGANQTVFARSICQARLSFVERDRTNLRPGRSRQTRAAQTFFVCIARAVGKALRHAQIAPVGGIVGRAVIPCAAFLVRNACAYIARMRTLVAVAYICAPNRAGYARFAFARNAIAAAAR